MDSLSRNSGSQEIFQTFPHLTGPETEMSRMGERWATGRFRGATILEDFRRLYQMGAHLQLWRTNKQPRLWWLFVHLEQFGFFLVFKATPVPKRQKNVAVDIRIRINIRCFRPLSI
jgi:hypothetical protein